jgi:hypothetical protein
MSDLDPKIWENPTLGSATNTPFLDVLEAQELENRRAAAEGREPMVAEREIVYPDYIASGSVPSDIQPIKLVPVDENNPPEVGEITPPVAEESPVAEEEDNLDEFLSNLNKDDE